MAHGFVRPARADSGLDAGVCVDAGDVPAPFPRPPGHAGHASGCRARGRTHAPEEDVVTALSNIEEVLLQQEAAEAAQRGDPTPSPEPTPEPAMSTEEVLDTVVYSVYNNAVYYHTGPVCNGQENRRQLTVRQAQSLGLGACPNCNPPVPVVATPAPAAGS